MSRLCVSLLAAAAALGLVAPAANAATLIGCGTASGLPCYASGNDHEGDVEDYIAQATGLDVDLTLYGKSDDGTAVRFNFTGLGTKDGTWDVVDPTVKIAYVTVKAGSGYAIYDVGGVGDAFWTTSGILNGGGKQPKLSHLSFWTVPTSSVPEPTTWLTLIAGFGMIGTAMRLRKAKIAIA